MFKVVYWYEAISFSTVIFEMDGMLGSLLYVVPKVDYQFGGLVTMDLSSMIYLQCSKLFGGSLSIWEETCEIVQCCKIYMSFAYMSYFFMSDLQSAWF